MSKAVLVGLAAKVAFALEVNVPLQPPCAVDDVGVNGFAASNNKLMLASALDCYGLCQIESACNSFTWNETSGMCYLLTTTWAPNQLTSTPELVSGKSPCNLAEAEASGMKPAHLDAQDTPPCGVYDQGYVPGPNQVVNKLWLSHPTACYNLCKLEAATVGTCNYYTWNQSDGACILLNSSVSTWAPNLPEVVGAPLECTPVQQITVAVLGGGPSGNKFMWLWLLLVGVVAAFAACIAWYFCCSKEKKGGRAAKLAAPEADAQPLLNVASDSKVSTVFPTFSYQPQMVLQAPPVYTYTQAAPVTYVQAPPSYSFQAAPQVMYASGPTYAYAPRNDLFEQIDKDGDGVITQEEFAAYQGRQP